MSTKNKTKEIKSYDCKVSYVRIGPDKLRRVANVVRGKTVKEALPILRNLPQKGSLILTKAIKSAIANYKDQTKNEDENLYISELMINEAPMMKRFQVRARGRIFQILKRSSHIRVSLKQNEGAK